MEQLAISLETIRQSCRICLQKGDINIWDFKVKFTPDETNYIRNQNILDAMEDIPDDMKEDKHISTLELLEIFNKTTDSLVLANEFPMLCWQCLEDFRLCYIFREKVKNSNRQLENVYEECLNQCIEEEHLVESEEMALVAGVKKVVNPEPFIIEQEQQFHIDPTLDIAVQTAVVTKKPPPVLKSSQRRTLDKNSSIVVTQYVPSTMEPPVKIFNTSNVDEDEEFQPPLNLHTMDCKTVEIKDFSELESLETSSIGVIDKDQSSTTNTTTTTTTAPVFVCQYCPQAFAKSEFLKTHIQRNHVCQFCMQSFNHYLDLCQHLRQHKEHKCVICHKLLSSQTNLRHHIKRVHQIRLPPKMTLLDFIQSKEEVDDNGHALKDALPEILIADTGVEDVHDYVEESLGEMYFSKAVVIEGMINGNAVLEIKSGEEF